MKEKLAEAEAELASQRERWESLGEIATPLWVSGRDLTMGIEVQRAKVKRLETAGSPEFVRERTMLQDLENGVEISSRVDELRRELKLQEHRVELLRLEVAELDEG